MNEKEENMKDLFERLFGSEQAEEIEQDIRKGEQMFREYPAPQPDRELIADIKTEITASLLRRKTNAFRRTVYKMAAVAAAVIIVSAISVRLFESRPSATGRDEKGASAPERVVAGSAIPESLWESEDLSTDDTDLAILTAEIEQIEDEILASRLGENGGNGGEDLTELEIELIAINSDFWKG
ncbi:MAG: hypothetical protein AMJ43_08110 [Coxiella sp. DG_40]|nr:MAG: hypothetical protein AMJ43_08110 [Coxiella sp. DG_40]